MKYRELSSKQKQAVMESFLLDRNALAPKLRNCTLDKIIFNNVDAYRAFVGIIQTGQNINVLPKVKALRSIVESEYQNELDILAEQSP